MATLPKPHPASAKFRPAKPAANSERTVAASAAKTHLLELLDQVNTRRKPVTITKRGRPVARLVPIEDPSPVSIFGCMKGTFKITGDIVGPEPDVWEAME
jgi:prevent-host-death family protein